MLARQLDDATPEPTLRARVHDVLASNGLESHAPEWFADLVQALLAGEATGRHHFPPGEMDGGDVDVSSALAELATFLPLGHDDYGEGVVLEPRRLRARAFISREGRDGSYFYEVGSW